MYSQALVRIHEELRELARMVGFLTVDWQDPQFAKSHRYRLYCWGCGIPYDADHDPIAF